MENDCTHPKKGNQFEHADMYNQLMRLIDQVGLSKQGFTSRLEDQGFSYSVSSIANWMPRGIPNKKGLLQAITQVLIESSTATNRCAASEVLKFLAPAGLPFVDLPIIAEMFPPEEFNAALSEYLSFSLDHADEVSFPCHVPDQRTSFIGRVGEIAQVKKLLHYHRLLTLWGTGGCGKTRLALQVAQEMQHTFRHGICFIDLATINAADMVPRHIACSLGCQDNLDETALDVWLKDYLHKRQGLLILDNFEHVIQAALFISDLLDATTGLHILVTSREPLMLYGEQRLEVSPLSLPTRLYDSSDVELESIMQQYEAVRLFVERAQNILAYFKLTRENFHAIIDICTHLDGIPLLIELAASRVAVYSPQHMVKELHHRLTLASGYYRDKHWRQQNAHVLLEWSYQLLEPYEQFFFVQLAIFKGYFRMEAAEAICSTGEKLPVKSLLEALIHKSLLRQTLFVSWFPHFFMLETIREYALERLKEQDGYPQLRQRHAEYYKVALEVALATSSQSDRKVMLDALQPEQENLRVALEWFQEQQIAEQAEHMASMLEMVFPT